ncbi:hypothetical protein WN943_007079 [Citrus x changshan-huyou]
MAMFLVDVVIKSLVDHEFYQISNGLLLPVKSHILSRSKPAMLADSELTVTNKCSDVDGPPLKKKEVQYFVWGKPVMFADSKVTVRKKCSYVDGPPLLELPPFGQVSYSIALGSGVAALTIWDWP